MKMPSLAPFWMSRIALAVLWLAVIPSAHAHVEAGSGGGFASGYLHPWSGLDHIAAMIAVGLWGAQLGAPAIWILPVTFPLIMAFGGFLGLIGIPLPGVEIGIALSALLLGSAVGTEFKPRHLAWAAVLIGAFGLFHGHAHGTELPPGENGLLFSFGFVMATGTLHGLGIGIGFIHRWSAGRSVLRLCGALIACGGAWFLWDAIRPESPELSMPPQPAETASTQG